MRKILSLFIAFLFVGVANAQEINWMSMNEALAAQAKKPKKIMVDVYTEWCGPCKMMDKRTFRNDALIEYVNENFYAVKFNAEGNETVNFKGNVFKNPGYEAGKSGRNSTHVFAQVLNIRGYPTLVFFDEKGSLIAPLVGYRTAEQLEIHLKMFASDDYKNIKTTDDWKAYRDKFEGVF